MRRSTFATLCCARPTAYLCFSVLFAATAPGCDDPDDLGYLELEGDDLVAPAVDDADSPDAASPADDGFSLAVEQSTRGAVPHETLVVFPPIRMDDLKPNHYPAIAKLKDTDVWHDLSIGRYDGGWHEYKPGLPAIEQNNVSWGTPVYAGIDGEVMACWRTAPFHAAFEDVEYKLSGYGNFIVIKAATVNKWLLYAHLDTNSIPSALCPKVSTNGGYLEAESEDPDDPLNSVNIMQCQQTGCPIAETYIEDADRPRVHAGQFIGRIGAIGNASGPHLHMQAGDLDPSPLPHADDRMLAASIHILFEHSYQAPHIGAVPPMSWTAASGLSIPDAVITDDVFFLPGYKREKTYTNSYRLAKFGGNSGADLLCHNVDQGNLYTDGDDAPPVEFGGTDSSGSATWCTDAAERLHTGDFNGDGLTDLLCHDRDTGAMAIDDGAVDVNGYTVFTGSVSAGGWCATDRTQMLVGDFDSDGKDDLLCHDHADGRRWIDRAYNGLGVNDAFFSTGWCQGHYARLHVGDLDTASPGDDLLCHDTLTGQIYIDATPSAAAIAAPTLTPIFGSTDKSFPSWCSKRGQRLFVANVLNTNLLDELVCHDSDTGATWINAPTGTGTYSQTSSVGAVTGHCTGKYDRVKFGDFDGDGKDDLLCFDQQLGARSIDYAALETSSGGVFGGVEWTSTGAWCSWTNQSLH